MNAPRDESGRDEGAQTGAQRPDPSVLPDAVRRLAQAAQAYYDAVESPDFGFGLAADTECRIAVYARHLMESIRNIRDFRCNSGPRFISRFAEREIDSLDSILEAQIHRWDWGFLARRDWEASIKNLRRIHEHKHYHFFLQSVLAWRSIPGVDAHENADWAADEAERRGLEPYSFPPGTTVEAMEQQTWERYRDWLRAPALGPSLPALIEGERDRLADAADRLRRVALQDFSPATAESADGASRSREEANRADAVRVAGDAKASDPIRAAIASLTPLQMKIVLSLHAMGALSQERRKVSSEVLSECNDTLAQSGNDRNAVAGLGRTGLVQSKTGAGGGIWLTEHGRHAAEILKTVGTD